MEDSLQKRLYDSLRNAILKRIRGSEKTMLQDLFNYIQMSSIHQLNS